MEAQEPHTVCPLRWQVSVLESFCEVPLAKGSSYLSVEVQLLSRAGVTGIMVLVYRASGGLDLYFEKSLELDMNWARYEPATAHLNVLTLNPVSFDDARCDVSEHAVEVDAKFQDVCGSMVEVHVRASFSKVGKPMFTPAPPQSSPVGLRFILMNTFRLLSRSATILVTVDGVQQEIRHFIVPGFLNPWTSAKVGGSFVLGSLVPVAIDFQGTGDSLFIGKSASGKGAVPWMRLTGFPALMEIKGNTVKNSVKGSFQVDSTHGTVARGVYQIEYDDQNITMTILSVKQDWKPPHMQLATAVLRYVRLLRRRNETWNMSAVAQILPVFKWLKTRGWAN